MKRYFYAVISALFLALAGVMFLQIYESNEDYMVGLISVYLVLLSSEVRYLLKTYS